MSFRRSVSDILLFSVTSAELVLLVQLTPTFSITDWIYVLQHLIVIGIALTRRPPAAQDRSMLSNASVLIAYTYPYAQVLLLRWMPGNPAWATGGFVLVAFGACLSFASLVSLGKRFGVRPALRGLATRGPYRVVRHPMYLAYGIADIGYNLQEWNVGTVLLVVAGWASLVYRLHAEERVISQDPQWASYVATVRHRVLPGVW